jgi:hypothetical protein
VNAVVGQTPIRRRLPGECSHHRRGDRTRLSLLPAQPGLLGINEVIAGVLRLRARNLEQGIVRLLGDEDLKKRVFDHPLVKTLGLPGRKPSYLPANKFALALLDLVVPAATGSGKVNEPTRTQIEQAINALPAELRSSLTLLWRQAAGDLDQFRTHVEAWFNDAMERVSGWYRRRVRAILLVIGLGVAVALNVSTVTVASGLWTDTAFER